MDQFDESFSIQSIADGYFKCVCFRMRIHTAPLIISMFGLFVCTLFTVFYSLNREYILMFPIVALYINHFLILLGNRLRLPKLYMLFVYNIKFLITMLVTGMLFYIYIVVGDARSHLNNDTLAAFKQEWTRVVAACILLLFAGSHRWFLRLIKLDYESMQYERLVQRTATIYSLMSEAQSRDEQQKLSPYSQATTVLIRPLLDEV